MILRRQDRKEESEMERNRDGQRKGLFGKESKKRAMLLAGAMVVALSGVLVIAKMIERKPLQEGGMGAAKHPEELKSQEDAKNSGDTADLGEAEVSDVPKAPETPAGSENSEPTQGDSVMLPEAGSILDTSAMTDTEIARYFFSQELTDSVFEKINGISYKDNDNIGREDLCYLRVLHVDLEGQTRIGEMIVNKKIAGDVLEILEELYANAYPIEKMVLIDAYGADDNKSMADNNSSAFNYRVIAGTDKLSNHSLGMAIDINPKYNPYVRTGKDGEIIIEPEGSEPYTDRQADFPYKIEEGDLCYRLFTEHGFSWGGNWKNSKDYQHFEKQ